MASWDIAPGSWFDEQIISQHWQWAHDFQKDCGVFLVYYPQEVLYGPSYVVLGPSIEQTLKSVLRSTDTMFKISANIWVLYFDSCSYKNMLAIEEHIHENLSVLSLPNGLPFPKPWVSGRVFFPESIAQINTVISDLWYQGQNHHYRMQRLRSSTISDGNLPENSNENLQQIVKGHMLCLAFQPVCDVSGKIFYYEALARLLDPQTQKLIAPGNFIPAAEKWGLIHKIDIKILQLALAELLLSDDLIISINVSAITLCHPEWLNTIGSYLVSHQDVARRLMIEFTETALFENIEESIAFMSKLKKMGCKIAIDDFGSGYLAITHLKNHLVDVVKIAGDFTMNLSKENLLFIRTILALTLPQKIKSVAECIENQDQIKLLHETGIDLFQGHHLGKPSLIRPWIV